MTTRAEVIAKAREYLGTPFHHEGRIKGLGIDCVGLPLCVAAELGLLDREGKPIRADDYPAYSLEPQSDFVGEEFRRRAIEKPLEAMSPGDVVTIRYLRFACHTAIVSELRGQLALIHAYSLGLGKVAEHVLDLKWRRRVVGVFALPGVTE